MTLKATLMLVLALALAGQVVARAQLEQAILAQLYYPPVQHARPLTSSTGPPYHRPQLRLRRSYFERDREPQDAGNDEDINRVRDKMADPNWTPEILPRTPSNN